MSTDHLLIKKPSPYAVIISCPDLRVREDIDNLLSKVFRKSAADINEISDELLNRGKAKIETYAYRDIAHTKAMQAIDLMRRESQHTSLTIDIQMMK